MDRYNTERARRLNKMVRDKYPTSLVGDTTLVTEHRLFEVNRQGRKRVTQAAVSARGNAVVRESFAVTQKDTFTVRTHPNKHLTIKSEHPVLAVFRQGEYEPKQPGNQEPVRQTAQIIVNDLRYGQNLIEIVDDVDDASVKLTVINMETGETENLTAGRIDGRYLAALDIDYSGKGDSFDCRMSAMWSDRLLFQYRDMRDADGNNVVVELLTEMPEQPDMPNLLAPLVVVPDAVFAVVCTEPVDHVEISSGDTHRPVLMQEDGGKWVGEVDLATFANNGMIEVKAMVAYGQVTVAVQTFVHVVDKPRPALSILDVSKRIMLRDSLRNGNTVEVIVHSGDGTFERILLKKVYDRLGIYVADWQPTAGGVFTATYVDTDKVLVKSEPVRIDVVDPEPEPEPEPELEPEYPDFPSYVGGEVEIEINGLFVLNGRFSGTVEIRAVEDELVRCFLVHSA